jgi:hypothetical protein
MVGLRIHTGSRLAGPPSNAHLSHRGLAPDTARGGAEKWKQTPHLAKADTVSPTDAGCTKFPGPFQEKSVSARVSRSRIGKKGEMAKMMRQAYRQNGGLGGNGPRWQRGRSCGMTDGGRSVRAGTTSGGLPGRSLPPGRTLSRQCFFGKKIQISYLRNAVSADTLKNSCAVGAWMMRLVSGVDVE